jgi:hypothetical protein
MPATEKQILFSAPMVRSILAGRKTRTRRVVRRHAQVTVEDFDAGMEEAHRNGWPGVIARGPCDGIQWRTSCPYGAVGDHLWVRETWAPHPGDTQDPPEWVVYAADLDWWGCSDTSTMTTRRLGKLDESYAAPRWRPSIFMPRWASRVRLRVTSVGVERLQAITEEGAVAEGVASVAVFREYWDWLNGKRPGCAWDDSPWVWVVGFERVGVRDAE